jgi:hypothetical protein
MPRVTLELWNGERRDYCVLLEDEREFDELERVLKGLEERGVILNWAVRGIIPTHLDGFKEAMADEEIARIAAGPFPRGSPR